MLFNLFKFLSLKKAEKDHIKKIFDRENFICNSENIDNMLKGNEKGVRYGNAVMQRNEKGQSVERFLKIMIDGKYRTYKLFERQVRITEELYKDEGYTFPKMQVIKHELDTLVPYAIFETRKSGQNFGFMHDTPSYYASISEKEMEDLVNTICSFHSAGSSINPNIWKYTQKISSDLNYYEKHIRKNLSKVIKHKRENGEIVESSVEAILAKYFQVKDALKSAEAILDVYWKTVDKTENSDMRYLVHADMQIDNIYKHENGPFELLDFEWVGRSTNPVIAIMYDYGNLRARAWSSSQFQTLLDEAMVRIGTKYYSDDAVKAGLRLGTLYSSIMMTRFHLDFENTVKKDRRSEAEYHEMYSKTVATLRESLKSHL
ncbi:MAG: hypothetical protein WC648_02030 [Candidatus Paceibacterota bacterium]|jgi:hypothetical protein